MRKRKGSAAENARKRAFKKCRDKRKLTVEYLVRFELCRNDFSSFTFPVQASNYIKFLSTLLKRNPGRPLFLYYRVSGKTQVRRGNGIDGMRELEARVRAMGGIIIASKIEQDKASDLSQRRVLRKLIRQAKAFSPDAIVVTFCRNRFLRAKDYHPSKPKLDFPTVAQYEELLNLASGVILATVLHPDLSCEDQISQQTKAGQKNKNRSGGRPRKKDTAVGYRLRRKSVLLPRAILLYRKGKSLRAIANKVNRHPVFKDITHVTIKKWLDEIAR